MVNFCYFSRFSQNCEKRKLASLALSVCLLSVRLLAWNNSVPTGRIFIKYEICVSKFYQENRRFIKKMTSIMGTLHAELCTLITLYQWILLRTRNDLDKNCRENQKTYLVKYLFFFPKIVSFVNDCGKILYGWTGHMRQHRACALNAALITATNTQSEYLILIASPR